MEIEGAIHLMDRRKLRRLPVIGVGKRLVLMLSLGDSRIRSDARCRENC